MLIMVTGVSGSGKSEYAEQISCQLAKDNKNIMWLLCIHMEKTAEAGLRSTSCSVMAKALKR